jgi:hypothetical protein
LASEGKTTRGASSSNSLLVCGGLKDMVLVIFESSQKKGCLSGSEKKFFVTSSRYIFPQGGEHLFLVYKACW